ncbi:hypothetical protein [Microcystis sp. M061S2]|uniref:hypothetical protein n=1 Tax=Microcystis sp. M061S2 TaxID=2771171 RepID=UPI00258DAFB1|nr:hypothetical protein [Microcystis sp. M061S2]MCA2655990.1 hypothetical protein [Microcystis sp. M061S2]
MAGFMLTLHHFDTTTRVGLELTEAISYCVANYLFPKAHFSVGHINLDTTEPKHLSPYCGQSLQFSSGQRMYFSDQPIGELLYPTPSDRAAYGSLPFTPCKSFHELRRMRVLVIDHETGDSNGVLSDRQFARELVGDCWGKMSLSLAEQFTSRTDTPIQFRLGIRPQEGNDHYRIAKGTLAPDGRIERLGGTIEVAADSTVARELNFGQYDLIFATSMFKGRKGAEAIAPGSYLLDLGLGVKIEAEYGRQKLGAQVLVNYPVGVTQDILPKLEIKAQQLKAALGSPHALAREFITYYEEKQEQRTARESGFDLFGTTFDALFDAETDPEGMSREETLYAILKTDLAHYGQLLEHPFVIDELKSFAQNRWTELAYSGGIKFHSALAQPCNKLADNEVCVPLMPDGTELILTRSPLVNSNGVIILTNRHIPELMSLRGCLHINPVTAAKHLQADFDGDRLAFERADKYPALAAEIKEKLLPEKRYPDVVKRHKVAYHGSFEEIALRCAHNDVGTIANQIMRAVSIYNDTLNRPTTTLPNYLKQVARYYAQQCEQLREGKLTISNHYHQPMQEIARHAGKESLSATDTQDVLTHVRTIQHQIVCDLSNELQVAVDGPKSSARPNMVLFEACKRVGNCIPVSFIKDKKNDALYRDEPATASTFCPVGMMARLVNQHFAQVHLSSRPIHLFRRLFPEPPLGLNEIGREIKEAYNEKLSSVAALRDALTRDPERRLPHLTLEHNRKEIAITHLDAFPTLELLANSQSLDVRLIPRPPSIKDDIPNHLFAQALINGQTCILGAVSLADSHGSQLKAGMRFDGATVSICPAITESRIEAGWRSLRSYVAMVRSEHSPEERRHLAAALWHAAHTKDEYRSKKSVVAFSLFPEESLNQLKELQFRELQVIGLQYPTNQHRGHHFDQGQVIAEVVEQPIAAKDGSITIKRGIAIEGKFLAPFQQESPNYSVGTIFHAVVELAPPASAIATLSDGTELEIRKVPRFCHAGVRFESQSASLTIESTQYGLLVSLNRSPLGLLSPQSADMIRSQYGAQLSRGKQPVLDATLTSTPSNTAIIRADPSSFQSPWQIEARRLGEERELGGELPVERVREQLRAQYIGYVGRAYELNPELAPGLALDLQVAQLANTDGRTLAETAALLSTSDVLLKIRPEPSSPAWESYEAHARQYVLEVIKMSDGGYQERLASLPRVENLDKDAHWRDRYLSYADRVRLANPFVLDSEELDRQVAALLHADGRSPDEAAAIFRARDALLTR